MGVSIEATGVSVGAANPDTDAIIAGGSAFITRMKELKASKEAAEASFKKLKVGQDAAAAYADAQINQQAAKQALVDAQTEADKIVAEAKTAAEVIVTAAGYEVEKLQNAKIAEVAKLDDDLKAAKQVLTEWSKTTTKKAETLLAQAEERLNAANAKMADNDQREVELAAARQEVDARIKAAKTAEDDFNAKLAAIKAAVS